MSREGQIHSWHLDSWNPEDDLLPMEGTLGPSLNHRSPAEKGRERRQQLTPVQCKGESVDHLYFSCAFTQSLLSQVLLAAGGLVNLTTTESFTSLADKLNTITNGSPPWGLNWIIIGALSWLIWRERNSRQKSNKFSRDLFREHKFNDQQHIDPLPGKYQQHVDHLP